MLVLGGKVICATFLIGHSLQLQALIGREISLWPVCVCVCVHLFLPAEKKNFQKTSISSIITHTAKVLEVTYSGGLYSKSF